VRVDDIMKSSSPYFLYLNQGNRLFAIGPKGRGRLSKDAIRRVPLHPSFCTSLPAMRGINGLIKASFVPENPGDKAPS